VLLGAAGGSSILVSSAHRRGIFKGVCRTQGSLLMGFVILHLNHPRFILVELFHVFRRTCWGVAVFFRERTGRWVIASLHRGGCGSASCTPKEVWDFVP